ncbi:hypothetical protein HAALTHF_22510n [Vreelandella aquamarina]|nr:hypothetical protein HAALTHF_22510n [Halomonas axialensis]
MLLATDAALHAKNPLWQGSGDLRVALVTTHLPLRDVADAITFERVTQISRLLAADLRRQFGILNPRIAVCGLNPMPGKKGIWGAKSWTRSFRPSTRCVPTGWISKGRCPPIRCSLHAT